MKLSFTIFRCQKAITTPFEDLSEEKNRKRVEKYLEKCGQTSIILKHKLLIQ